MNLNGNHFSKVTLLITHYNRSQSLERLLQAIKNQGISFGEVIVSDDGSKPEHVQYLQHLQNEYAYQLLTVPQNKGLGNNINKGQDAVTLPYTLYIQEDFEPMPSFVRHLKSALSLMQADESLDIARFYAYFAYPYLNYRGKGFAEMVFKPGLRANNHLKFYMYSDHPHLRRSNFFEKFGRYAEGIKGDLTEYQMAKSFIQNNGRGIFFEKFDSVFYQKNSAEEPSTMNRANWRESKNGMALALRYVYLQFKLMRWTYDVLYKR